MIPSPQIYIWLICHQYIIFISLTERELFLMNINVIIYIP